MVELPDGEVVLGALDTAIGMHVPAEIPAARGERPENLQDVDLFKKSGEMREIIVRD